MFHPVAEVVAAGRTVRSSGNAQLRVHPASGCDRILSSVERAPSHSVRSPDRERHRRYPPNLPARRPPDLDHPHGDAGAADRLRRPGERRPAQSSTTAPGRHRPAGAAGLHHHAPADRGAVLRGRAPRSLGHPLGPAGWLDPRGRAAQAHPPGHPGERRCLHAPGGDLRRSLAVRRPRRLLGRGRSEHRLAGRRQQVPAWLPGDGRERDGPVHHDLPRLVSRPRRPHPLQGPDGARRTLRRGR